MALTIATALTPPVRVEGDHKVVVADVTFDSSYTTGGFTLTPSTFGLNRIDYCTCDIKTPVDTVTSVVYVRSTGKLKANIISAEVTSTTDLSSLVVQVVVYGK